MLEIESEVLDVYLHPGESYLARKPAIIRTILGSCVGVAFWSELMKLAESSGLNRTATGCLMARRCEFAWLGCSRTCSTIRRCLTVSL